MADNEYIKRSEVVGLIEGKIKRCVTVPEAFACASLRTAVMGLRSADVAPRAEVAAEIFEEIEKIGIVTRATMRGEIIYNVSAEYTALKNKYTGGNNL